MKTIAGFPCYEIEFDKKGKVHDPAQEKEVLEAVAGGAITDVFVLGHGWNNDMKEARDLYAALLQNLRNVLSKNHFPALATRKPAVVQVFWPSKKFADKDLIASGAASANGPVKASFVESEIDDLASFFDTPAQRDALMEARALVAKLPDSPAAQGKFIELVRSLVSADAADKEDASERFFAQKPELVMAQMSKPAPAVLPPPSSKSGGGATHMGAGAGGTSAGSAAGLGSFFSGILSGARNALNYVTYYEMKNRAGTVGRGGVNALLRKMRAAKPDLKLHLIGHSFGGRLVTAAADGPQNEAPVRVNTMTLLQAAFSHNGFAQKFLDGKDGAFRRIVTEEKVSGPIVVTHTKNDQAVGTAYPLASLLAGQNASAMGDANDPYGGIGRNGAQKTPEAENKFALGPVGTAYAFTADKRVYNLNSDAIIKGHSDICHDQVAYAILAAVATT